jgi:hypothetical protein
VKKNGFLPFLIESIQESQLLFQYPDQIQSSVSQKRILGPPYLPETIMIYEQLINEKENVGGKAYEGGFLHYRSSFLDYLTMLQLKKLQQSSLCFFLSVELHNGYYTPNPRNLCPKNI